MISGTDHEITTKPMRVDFDESEFTVGAWYYVIDTNEWLKTCMFFRVESFNTRFVSYRESLKKFVYRKSDEYELSYRTPGRMFFPATDAQMITIKNSMTSKDFNI